MQVVDLFSALSKYGGSRHAEDYLTEAFAHVLRELLARQHAVGVDLANRLCGADGDFGFREDETVSVETQQTTAYGRPDMALSAPGKLAFIEVKDESWLHDGQPERYVKALEAAGVPHTRLVLLTRYAVEVPQEIERLRCVRWSEMHGWLSEVPTDDAVASYLVCEFARFLKEKGMAIRKVGWELAPGLVAFGDFIAVLDAAWERADIKARKGPPRGTATYFGWMIDSPKYWLGVSYEERPLRLCFQLCRGCSAAVKEQAGKVVPAGATSFEGDSFFLDLEDENVCFFALGEGRQIDALTEFIRSCYARVKEVEQAVGASRAGDDLSGGAGEPECTDDG